MDFRLRCLACLALALFLFGCRQTAAPPLTAILPAAAGEWSRKSVAVVPPGGLPATLKASGATPEAATADYQSGQTTIRITIADLKIETNAFEAIQKWPPPSGPALYKGKYFLFANSSGQTGSETAAAASCLLRALQSALP